jgi:hypothetical protein
MLNLASAQLLARSLGCALIAATVGKEYVGFMIVGELALFLLYKAGTKDFLYWINVQGYSRYVLSILIRAGVKIVADYTGLLQLRHPQEVGGLYFR